MLKNASIRPVVQMAMRPDPEMEKLGVPLIFNSLSVKI